MFHSVDDFFDEVEKYLGSRIINGKFLYDLFVLCKKFAHTSIVQIPLLFVYQLLLKYGVISVMARIGEVITDGLYILRKYSVEFLLVFGYICLPSSLILLSLFETTISLFFICILPVLFIDLACLSVFYLLVDANEKGERLTLIDVIHLLQSRLFSLAMVLFFTLFLIATCVLGFFLLGALLRLLLSAWLPLFILDWVISFIGFAVWVGLFFISFVACQAYFYSLVDQKNPILAFRMAIKLVHIQLPQFLFFCITFSLCYFPLLYLGISWFFDVGFVIVFFSLIQFTLLLHFLLRRRFIKANSHSLQTFDVKLSPNFSTLFLLLFLLGIVSYIICGVFSIRYYPQLLTIYEKAQIDNAISKDLWNYQDTMYGYKMAYPKSWSIYHWDSRTVRFFYNYTGTQVGIVYVQVNVSDYSQSAFATLFANSPGLYLYNETSHELVTKVSNLTIQGYEAVHYTDNKPGTPNTEYQSHYVIHKGDSVYDICLVTYDQSVNDDTDELFQKVVSSFRFVE